MARGEGGGCDEEIDIGTLRAPELRIREISLLDLRRVPLGERPCRAPARAAFVIDSSDRSKITVKWNHPAPVGSSSHTRTRSPRRSGDV